MLPPADLISRVGFHTAWLEQQSMQTSYIIPYPCLLILCFYFTLSCRSSKKGTDSNHQSLSHGFKVTEAASRKSSAQLWLRWRYVLSASVRQNTHPSSNTHYTRVAVNKANRPHCLFSSYLCENNGWRKQFFMTAGRLSLGFLSMYKYQVNKYNWSSICDSINKTVYFLERSVCCKNAREVPQILETVHAFAYLVYWNVLCLRQFTIAVQQPGLHSQNIFSPGTPVECIWPIQYGCVWLCAPVTDWWPIQGVSRLYPTVARLGSGKPVTFKRIKQVRKTYG